ncbi:hypothetical protein PpBr36_04609 [Pyricularia pennisetigena]|nr:hypothetical protein PpBr36_04609 [Pyricularia pennisetigena]TLS27572.1 hypothetical protein PpBr36_04609 [Pyricularia pennisetigena]
MTQNAISFNQPERNASSIQLLCLYPHLFASYFPSYLSLAH